METIPMWAFEEALELMKQSNMDAEELEAWQEYQAMADDHDELPVHITTPPELK